MTLEELEEIFKPQLDAGEPILFFIYVHGEYRELDRQDADKLALLIPLLKDTVCVDRESGFPVFQAK